MGELACARRRLLLLHHLHDHRLRRSRAGQGHGDRVEGGQSGHVRPVSLVRNDCDGHVI